MKLKTLRAAFAATVALAAPALAEITVTEGYARSSGIMAKSGAAFMMIQNTGDADDHLINVISDAAKRAELHTHIESDDGIMRMVHVQEGFEIPAGEIVMLKRGGKHVMFMGLTKPFIEGESVTLTLVFRDAGKITVSVPVDLTRQDSGMTGTN